MTIEVAHDFAEKYWVLNPSKHQVAARAEQPSDFPGNVTMIYRQAPFLFVAILAATAAFLSAAYGTYATLGFQHGIPLGWRYAKQPDHSSPSVAFLHRRIVAILSCIALAILLVDALGVAIAPSYGIISYASFAACAAAAAIGWKHFWRFLFAAFLARSHYENVARNLA